MRLAGTGVGIGLGDAVGPEVGVGVGEATGLAVGEDEGAAVGVAVGVGVGVGVGCVPVFEPKEVDAATEPIIIAIITIAVAIMDVVFIFFPCWIYRERGNIGTQHRIQTAQ